MRWRDSGLRLCGALAVFHLSALSYAADLQVRSSHQNANKLCVDSWESWYCLRWVTLEDSERKKKKVGERPGWLARPSGALWSSSHMSHTPPPAGAQRGRETGTEGWEIQRWQTDDDVINMHVSGVQDDQQLVAFTGPLGLRSARILVSFFPAVVRQAPKAQRELPRVRLSSHTVRYIRKGGAHLKLTCCRLFYVESRDWQICKPQLFHFRYSEWDYNLSNRITYSGNFHET